MEDIENKDKVKENKVEDKENKDNVQENKDEVKENKDNVQETKDNVQENEDNAQENKYAIQKALYKTKIGELFLVTKNADENEFYVMKHIEVKSNEEKTNILNEIKKYSHINTKSIIKIKEFFIENINEKEIISLIFDYFEENKNLYNIIYNANFLISKNIWKIFIKLVIAIKSLHDQNIIIDDLNPHNIFLDKNNNIQIGGISKIHDLNNINRKKEEIDFSPYKSPEILKNENYDNKCNIWSLGCILYEMAFKKLAFNNNENIINIKYELPEDADEDIKNILKKLICEQNIRLNCKDLIFGIIFKKKLIEVNCFSEIISNDMKSFNYYFSTNIGIFDPKAAVDRFKLIEYFEHPFYLKCKKCNTPPEIILKDNDNIIISCYFCGIYENETIENVVNYSSKWVTNEIMAIPCSTKHPKNDSLFIEKEKKRNYNKIM
jgi:serine/threonine protein kinase